MLYCRINANGLNRFMSATHHILLVDDDQTLRDALAEQLALYDEFKVSSAPNATASLKAVQAERIDLVVMDVGLPDMDGREAVKLMRKNGFKGPVVMLTGQGSDADTVLGLEAGANDYVVKPFKFAVLLARSDPRRISQLVARLRHQVESVAFRHGGRRYKVTASLGATCYGSGVTVDDILASADSAMYEAKQARREARPARLKTLRATA